jgi:hypothetical protein
MTSDAPANPVWMSFNPIDEPAEIESLHGHSRVLITSFDHLSCTSGMLLARVSHCQVHIIVPGTRMLLGISRMDQSFLSGKESRYDNSGSWSVSRSNPQHECQPLQSNTYDAASVKWYTIAVATADGFLSNVWREVVES